MVGGGGVGTFVCVAKRSDLPMLLVTVSVSRTQIFPCRARSKVTLHGQSTSFVTFQPSIRGQDAHELIEAWPWTSQTSSRGDA